MEIGYREKHRILHSDCLQILPTITDNSIDLIFADPPYNIGGNPDQLRPDTPINSGTLQ